MALGKRCVVIPGSAKVTKHVRCYAVKDKSESKKGSGKNSALEGFNDSYGIAQKSGHLPKDMSHKEVIEMSGYHSDFGDIKSQKFTNTKNGFEVEIETDNIKIRTIHSKDKVYIDLVESKGEGGGKAKKLIGNIVKRGQEQDIKTIELFGAARLNDRPANGYYTWPRLGFETKNKKALKEYNSYDKNFKGVDSLLDLMSTKAGRDYWKSDGPYHPDRSVYEMTFDLKYGSKSLKHFENNT